MQPDRYLKAVLTVIAVCLVWICLRDMELVKPAQADLTETATMSIQSSTMAIQTWVMQIALGTCTNGKIC
jgi:hypothetical protein